MISTPLLAGVRNDAHDAQRPNTDSAFDTDGSRRKPLVLVVDDEEVIATSLAEILEGEGFATEIALSGSVAVDIARAHRPDLVISDVLMPDMDGVQTAVAIRSLYADVRVLLFSGQAGTSDIIARAREDGHEFELLPKPLHPAKLLAAIHRLM